MPASKKGKGAGANMSDKSIVGKEATFFLDGGWQISGEVRLFEDKKIVVETDGDLSIIFKDKVSCMTILRGEPKLTEQSQDEPQPPFPRPTWTAARTAPQPSKAGTFPMNGISYEDSVMSIPLDIAGLPEGDEDFSVSFSDAKDQSKLSFGLEHDSDK